MALSMVHATWTPPVATNGIVMGDAVDTWLTLTGASGSYASTPDATALDITGDLEIVVRVALDSWTAANSQTLVAKWGISAGTCSYELEVRPGGELRLNHSTDGTATKSDTSTVTLPSVGLLNGSCYWLKATLDVDNGAAGRTTTFYWAYDSDVEPQFWTTLGTAVTTAGVTSIFSSGANLYVGALSDGSFRATGKVWYAAVRNAIGSLWGTATAFAADFGHQTAGASSFTAGTGQTVTVNSPAALTQDPNPWRFAVEALIASGGARVGVAQVGTDKVSSYEWYDITGDLQGLEFGRGRLPSASGYPRPDAGVCNFQLDNTSGKYSPWNQSAGTYTGTNISTSKLYREFGPKTLIRVVHFKANAATAASWNNGFYVVPRAHWSTRFTGFIEDWNETLELNRNTVNGTAVETTAFLARTNKAARASQGASEALYGRISRLLSDASFPFVPIEGNTPNSFRDAGYGLQATTLAGNRLAELQLACETVQNTQVWADTDGNLRVGYANNLRSDATKTTYPEDIVRLTSSTRAVASDLTNFPKLITAYYQTPIQLSNGGEFIVNYVSATRVGGTAQVSQTVESQGQYGLRGITRTDLIGISDTMSLYFGDLLRTELDAYQDPNSAPLTRGVDQSLVPAQIVLTDQDRAQRALDLGRFVLVDYYSTGATSPSVRMACRITQMRENYTKVSDGFVWTTTLGLMPRYNYIPT